MLTWTEESSEDDSEEELDYESGDESDPTINPTTRQIDSPNRLPKEGQTLERPCWLY